MAKVWKILALLLVITALVWLTTMWRWQSAQRDPSGTDLVLHLGVLPVVLTAGLVLALWGVTRLRTYAAAPVMPVASAAAAPSAPAVSAASERSESFRVLASDVQVRAGSQWDGARTRIAEGECKPDLDPQLKDDDGVAVFTAPMPDVSTDTVADALAELLAPLSQAKPQEWAGYEPPPQLLRTLALLGLAMGSAQEAIEAQWPALSAPPVAQRNRAAAPVMLPPCVSIRLAIPARWSPQSQQLATAWLQERFDPFIEAGLMAAGQSRAMAQSSRPAVQLHVHPVDTAEALWLLMEQQLMQWQRDKEAGLLWVMAADSLVSDDEVQTMASAQQLFSGANQRGRVPGEGAAGLLLASSAWPVVPGAQPAAAQLHRANLLRRDKSADASGRVGAQVLQQAATDALQASACEAAQVAHLTTDADHRGSRTSEVYETLQELLPHLDPGEHTLRLGAGCGDLGVARLLACVALTVSQVQASNKPALVLGAFPAFERFAALVAPAAAPAETPAPAPAA